MIPSFYEETEAKSLKWIEQLMTVKTDIKPSQF